MAKGNDGHVLQHGVECDLVRSLTQTTDATLFVTLTHGMAPTEPFLPKRSGAHGLIDAALSWALEAGADDDPPVIQAYRITRATPQRYPNSAELIAALIGEQRLVGTIAEVDPGIAARLDERWRPSGLKVVARTWRSLPTPTESLEGPWFLSMDPHSYKVREYQNDNHFHAADWRRLRRLCAPLVASRQPGAAVVFCYSLRPASVPGGTLESFHRDGARFAAEHELEIAAAEVAANGAHRHVALMFSQVPGLVADASERLRELVSRLGRR